MISGSKRTCSLVVWVLPFVLVPAIAQAQKPTPTTQTAAVSSIQLSYKRDPRMVDGTRGMGPWVSGPNYAGAYAQDTVEVRAEGVDATGKPVRISPEWIPSNTELVTVTPTQGDDVKITARRDGESRVRVTYQGLSTELSVKAKTVGKFISFEITELAAAKKGEPASADAGAPATPRTRKDVSYAAGMNLARALQEQSVDVDVDSLTEGIKDTLSGGKTLMTDEQVVAALGGLQTDLRVVQANLTRKALAEKNKREGEAFLAENGKKEGVVTLPSGLQYKIIKAGEGKKPTENDSVVCGYRGSFIDGRQFADSYKQSASATFPVKSVIKGWSEALQLMPVGSKWELFVPPELAYGEHGAGGGGGRKAGHAHPIIGPNATLVFDLELLAIKQPGAGPSASSSAAAKDPLTPEMIDALKKILSTEQKQ